MYDLQFHLMNRPGTLAELGEAMGRAGVPLKAAGFSAMVIRPSPIFCFWMAKPQPALRQRPGFL